MHRRSECGVVREGVPPSRDPEDYWSPRKRTSFSTILPLRVITMYVFQWSALLDWGPEMNEWMDWYDRKQVWVGI